MTLSEFAQYFTDQPLAEHHRALLDFIEANPDADLTIHSPRPIKTGVLPFLWSQLVERYGEEWVKANCFLIPLTLPQK